MDSTRTAGRRGTENNFQRGIVLLLVLLLVLVVVLVLVVESVASRQPSGFEDENE